MLSNGVQRKVAVPLQGNVPLTFTAFLNLITLLKRKQQPVTVLSSLSSDTFRVITSAETTTEMLYFTSDVCGILYPSAFGIVSAAVVHGLRTESVSWGLEIQEATTMTYGSLLVQVDAGNAEWPTDCGKHCPAVKRHISDFSTQRVFAFNETTTAPDIIAKMERSALVWRPLPECRNPNCLYGVVDRDSSSW